MKQRLTPLGGSARLAYLTAGVLLLHTPITSASAQLLAAASTKQWQTTPSTPAQNETVLLKDLLSQWEKDYHVTIFYESQLVGSKKVLPQAEAGTLEKKLDAVLPQAALQFKKLRSDYFIVVGKSATAPQTVPVSGTVTDEKGSPLPGVTVLVKGTTIGTASNGDGSFLLEVPENSVITFSYIGYVRQDVPVTGATTGLKIQMAEDAQSLSEVVVVGYGTQARQELTTAVTSVGAAALSRQPVAGFDQALQGQAPGVQVTSPSGAPGAAINVRIRGNATVSLNGSPLYVIDGVPILPSYDQEISVGNQRVNPLNALNPNDIESIDVLKDGAAAAIYGVRAANGVVVVTTKRGKIGKPQVGLSIYYGVQKIRKKLAVLNSQQFGEYYNTAFMNANPSNGPYFTQLDTLSRHNTNWQDETYRQAVIQSYQLNVSGASDRNHYYVSGGYFKQDGISRNSGFERYNFKLNLDQQLGTRARIGTSLNLSRTFNNNSVTSEQERVTPAPCWAHWPRFLSFQCVIPTVRMPSIRWPALTTRLVTCLSSITQPLYTKRLGMYTGS